MRMLNALIAVTLLSAAAPGVALAATNHPPNLERVRHDAAGPYAISINDLNCRVDRAAFIVRLITGREPGHRPLRTGLFGSVFSIDYRAPRYVEPG